MKALDESILMVLFVLLLKRVHFLTNETKRCEHSNETRDRQSGRKGGNKLYWHDYIYVQTSLNNRIFTIAHRELKNVKDFKHFF